MIGLKNIFHKIYDYLHLRFKKYQSHKTDKTFNIYKCSDNRLLPKNNKNEIINWLETFNHTHFLTIQFHNNIKTDNYDLSKELLRQIMARFEANLIKRNWNKHHLPLIAFAEKGKGVSWHYHILFNSDKYTTHDLKKALDKSLVIHHIQQGDTIRVRYLSVEQPYEGAEEVEANLEDAYLCLLKNMN